MSLPTTKATTATTTHAVVQAIETYIQNQNLLGEIAELDEVLYEVIELHKDNELALKRVLHCIYNLLQNNNKYNVKFGAKVFHKLISVIIADATSFCRQLVANLLICVQIYYRKFPRNDGKFLMQQLWSLSLNNEYQPHAGQILVQLFDDFAHNLGDQCCEATELQLVIKNMLHSQQREERKTAYFLMRKLAPNICTELQWNAYITIMENLEEQQSHLVLPTLQTLLPQIVAATDDEWIGWLRILYIRLLQQNNILVLRWILHYFFKHFNLHSLSRAEIMPFFLAATNRTQLYNGDSYFLPAFKMADNFFNDDLEEFLKALLEIKWHSLPLLCWLRNLPSKYVVIINVKVFLELCALVGRLANKKLRKMANQRIFQVFPATIDSLSINDYLHFVQVMFNTNDYYYEDHERLIAKMQDRKNVDAYKYYFFNNYYEIMIDIRYINRIVPELVQLIPALKYNGIYWLCWFPIFHLHHMQSEIKQMCCEFFSTQYGLNMQMLNDDGSCNFNEIEKHLVAKLTNSREDCLKETKFLKKLCIDWFVDTKLQTWRQIEELNLRPVILLERGSKRTIIRLSELLKNADYRIEQIDEVLESFLRILAKNQNCELAVEGILTYAFKFMSDKETEKLVQELLNLRKQNIEIMTVLNAKKLHSSLVVQGLLDGEISTGDARIEAIYIDSEENEPFGDIVLRNGYINYIMKQSAEEVNAICEQLLVKNKQLSEKKPRYYENCQEHRIKIRIARTLLMLRNRLSWSDELWNALMEPTDQLNISYIYECLVSRLLPSFDLLWQRMQSMETLKPSQQVSLVSVAHLYCIRNWASLEPKDLQKVISFLLPQTMGANFQTRLLAQLVIHQFAAFSERSGTVSPVLDALMTSIEQTLGTKLHNYQNETRLILSEVMTQLESTSQADAILYMTNATFDEYDKTFDVSDLLKTKLDAHRKVLKTKRNPTNSTQEQMPMEVDNLNVQRKMNPVNDIFNTNDIIATDAKVSSKELIVVASLIDKLPNLGGLARTCEVLGVKQFILNNKSLAEKPDFTNLSMTAEKTLNILEVKPAALANFLIEQQTVGYKIIGAEQTAYSVSFADFQFPEKCILLLGHEKHGIPVDLIALLDFAVEIPQLGVVRSLNVHVTGSLFIWEYCKQHLNK